VVILMTGERAEDRTLEEDAKKKHHSAEESGVVQRTDGSSPRWAKTWDSDCKEAQ